MNHCSAKIAFGLLCLALAVLASAHTGAPAADTFANAYHFDRTISRKVLENHLARAITMEGRLKDRSKGGKTYSGWTCEHLPYFW